MDDETWVDLTDRFVDGDVTAGHMFGCAGLRTGRRFFAIRWHEQLVVKLPPTRLAQLVTEYLNGYEFTNEAHARAWMAQRWTVQFKNWDRASPPP